MKMNFQNNQQQVSATKNINTTIKESIKERMTTAAGNGRWHSVVQKQYPPTIQQQYRPQFIQSHTFRLASPGRPWMLFLWGIRKWLFMWRYAGYGRPMYCKSASSRESNNKFKFIVFIWRSPQQQYNIDPLAKTIMNHQSDTAEKIIMIITSRKFRGLLLFFADIVSVLGL